MFGSNSTGTQSPVQIDSSAMQDVPNPLSFTQSQKTSALLAIEEGVGHEIENDLEKRAQQLPNVEIENLVNEYMQSSSVRKFILRNKAKFSELDAAALNELLKKYFASQINFAQSVTLERDLLTVSQYIRQYFGLDQAIDLLEKIADPSFDLEAYLSLNLHDLDAKQKAAMNTDEKAEPNNSVFANPIKLQEIQNIIHRIKNIYAHAEIKKLAYSEPELKKETSYKNFQESLMWINGQRLACLTGMKNIRAKKVEVSPVANIESIPATPLQGARALLQNTIGMFVDDELQNLSHQLATKPVAEIVNLVKAKETYGQFISALNNATHAGFKTYLPYATVTDLIRLTEEYLYISVHLAQSIMHEKNLVKISQNIRQEYNIETSKKLLTDIEKPDFDLEKFFRGPKKPSAEIKTLIESIHNFYVYAAIKKQDNFFDAEEDQAKKLFESEMWLNIQRRCCIQGMSLIQSGNVYLGTQIDFVNLDQTIEVAEEKPQTLAITTASKKARLEQISSAIAIPSSQPSVVNWGNWQSLNEEEALAIALAESTAPQPLSDSQREQKELEEAIARSMLSVSRPIAMPQPQRPAEEKRDSYQRTELMLAASAGDLHKVSGLVESGAGNINSIGQQGNKAIHYAAINGRESVVAYLISKGASPTETNQNSKTPQQLLDLGNIYIAAAARGDIPELTRLVNDFKVSADIRNDQNKTALMVAAANGQLATVKYLFETARANLDAVGPYGNKAIHWAAQNDRENVLAYLIAEGASPIEVNNNCRSAHQLANISNKFTGVAANTRLTEQQVITELERLRNVFKISADCRNDQNKTALMIAAQNGRVNVVKYLVETCEVNLNAAGPYGNKAIHCAAQAEQDDVVAYLISKNASPTEPNNNLKTAHDLMSLSNKFVAITANARLTEEQMIVQLEYLRTTFKISADCRNDQNKTALMIAAQNGHLNVVKYLLEVCLVNINAAGPYGNKAIHCAAQNDQQEVMAYLIGLGASPTETNNNIKSAHDLANLNYKFVLAAGRDEIDNLKKMITALKVDPETARDQYNRTALIAAVIAEKMTAVRFLIEECGVAVDAVDGNQKNAMHYAATGRHQAIIDYLVGHGAQPIPQPQAPAIANSLASSAEAAPVNIPAGETILADAQKILAGLQRVAKLTENEIDDSTSPYYGTSDENDNKYQRTHNAEFSLQAAGISEERFYAACDLLENALGQIRMQDNNNTLELGLNPGTDRIRITAQYSLRLRQLRYMSDENHLKSPIAQFPFDKMKTEMYKVLTASFSNWRPADFYDHKLTKKFRNSEEMYQALSGIFAIEKACGEIEKDFKLNIDMSENHRNENSHEISVDKVQLARAKSLCGYSTAVQYGQSPSMASLVAANSSVMQSVLIEQAELIAGRNEYDNSHPSPYSLIP